MTMVSPLLNLNPDERRFVLDVLGDLKTAEEVSHLFPSSIRALEPIVARIALLSNEERAALLEKCARSEFAVFTESAPLSPLSGQAPAQIQSFFIRLGATLFAEVLKGRPPREQARLCQDMGTQEREQIREQLREPLDLSDADRSRIKKVFVRLIDEGGQPKAWLQRAGIYFLVWSLAPRWSHLVPIWIDHLPDHLREFARNDYLSWSESSRWDWGQMILPVIGELLSSNRSQSA
jgi:hypothetical protein